LPCPVSPSDGSWVKVWLQGIDNHLSDLLVPLVLLIDILNRIWQQDAQLCGSI